MPCRENIPARAPWVAGGVQTTTASGSRYSNRTGSSVEGQPTLRRPCRRRGTVHVGHANRYRAGLDG